MKRKKHKSYNDDDGDLLPSQSLDISPQKAAKILRDGTVHGKKLTKKQRGLFGARASRGKR